MTDHLSRLTARLFIISQELHRKYSIETFMAKRQLTASYIATNASFDISTESGLHAWISWHYREEGFRYNGTYQSLAGLRAHLFALDTGLSRTSIRQAIQQ